MRIGSDAAHFPFGNLKITFFVEEKPETDEEIERLAGKLDDSIDEIEEAIRVFVALHNEFALVTKR